MSGYSYFNYDQMTLLKVEVHSDELELLQQVADVYDWKTIQTEVEPKFKEAAFDFRHQKPSDVCPHQDKPEKDLQETFPFLATTAAADKVSNGNPKGAGRKGQDFLSYLKAFLLAPVLRAEQNCEAIYRVPSRQILRSTWRADSPLHQRLGRCVILTRLCVLTTCGT